MKAKQLSARDTALRLLSNRAYGRRELCSKLQEKGFDECQAEDAMVWLVELHYLNDLQYAQDLALAFAAKGYGTRRIRCELARRLLDDADIETALADSPPADGAIDAVMARMTAGQPLDVRLKKRMADALYRKGFDWDDIKRGFFRLEK